MTEPEPMTEQEIGNWTAGYKAWPDPLPEIIDEETEALHKTHRAVMSAIALARQEEERADVLARKLDAADKLAVAVGKLPITGGPVWESLRAYREAVK